MPTTKKLLKKYGSKGLVFVGIHTGPAKAEMLKAVKDLKMDWPTLYDEAKKTAETYHVSAFPSYFLVDRKGTLRVADIDDPDLEKAIVKLIGEKAPAAAKAKSKGARAKG